MTEYIILMRPQHWIKNGFIFLPLFFAGEFLNFSYWPPLLTGFLVFCMIASAVYILNDYRDIASDRLHPEKSKRPLASGKVRPGIALVMFILLTGAGFILAYFINLPFLVITSIYLIVNILYSFGLKHVSILDVMIVAVGFNIRLKAGGIVADVHLSAWINIMVFLLAMFIAVGKRRDDLVIQQVSGITVRKSLTGYNLTFLNAWLGILTAVVVVSYLMYTLSPDVIERMGTYRLYYTGIFVLAGMMRYLQLAYIDNTTSSPIRIIYTDRFIQAVLLCWIIAFFIIIYLPNDPLFR